MKTFLLNLTAYMLLIGIGNYNVLAAPLRLSGPAATASGLVAPDPQLENGVRVFRGIPFAAPPVDDLRWKAPTPPNKWKGVREAKTFSKECVQGPAGDPLYALYYPTAQPQSEDCLYINVWTPAHTAKDKLAVLVWIYGGGFQLGSGSQPIYNPSVLAKRGVVTVTFNYRVGIMGFFTHPELAKESGHDASGNYAFMDQLAALKWVHDNIASFGGDPARITVAGHSAGAGSTSVLAVSPLAKGLLHRVIPQSLAPGRAIGNARRRSRLDAEKAGVDFGVQIGAPSIAELRKKTAAEIMAGPGSGGFGPIVDGYVLPYDVETSYTKGVANDVAMLVGEVRDTAQIAASGRSHISTENLRQQVDKQFGSIAPEFFRLFPAPGTPDGGDIAMKNANDAQGYWRAWRLAAVHAANEKSPTFLYHFTRVPPVPKAEYPGVPGAVPGAFHGAELSYMLDNLAYKKWPWTDTDRKLTDVMSSYWVNFINTGNPNGPGLPEWPKFTVAGHETIELGDKIGPFRENKEVLHFFEKMPASVGP